MTHRTPQALGRAGVRALATAFGACLVAGTLANPAAAVHVAASSSAARPPAQQLVVGQRLVAHLDGAAEVPNGDPNGTGRVVVRLRPATHTVCARARWHRIGTPTMAHIHRGRAGVSGDVKIDLSGSVTGGAHCARGVHRALILRILAHPRRYYFNIHTRAYPAGAIRGQLHRP